MTRQKERRARVTPAEEKRGEGNPLPLCPNEAFAEALENGPFDPKSRQKQETSRALLNATSDSAVLIDPKGIVIDSNNNMAGSLGTTRDALIGSVIHAHMDPGIAKKRREKELEAFREKKLVRFVDSRDERWMENSIYPVFEPGGKLAQFAIFSRDITEQIKTENALRESEHYYRALFESASDAIFIVEGPIWIDCNQQALNMFCCTREQLIGKTPLDVSPPFQPDGQDSREKMQKLLQGLQSGSFQIAEWKHRRFDGTLFDAEVHLTPLDTARPERHMAIVRDITKRKTAEDALNRALTEVRIMKDAVEAENIYLHKEIRNAHLHGEIVGKSNAIRSVLSQAELVAETNSTVLILGETGTGKELLARAIHSMSPRKNRSLVVVNCSAIPSTLVESELFGREKGAFTGAIARQIGRFEIANGSTIFLDEIGELSLDVQAKLLRVLQEGEIDRLGSTRKIKIDVRVIAATNRDLKKALMNNSFRKDLFYRLNVFPISIPPLRNRMEDIPSLVWHFVDLMSLKMGKRIEKIPQRSIDNLMRHHWPGNIRELHNIIERAMIQTNDSVLRVPPIQRMTHQDADLHSLVEVEKQHMLKILAQTGWRIRGRNGAAEILDIKPTTLESRLQKLGIRRPK